MSTTSSSLAPSLLPRQPPVSSRQSHASQSRFRFRLAREPASTSTSTVVMYGTGDGGVGVDAAQLVWGGVDGKPGEYPYTQHVFGVGSSVAPITVPVPCCCWCVAGTRSTGTRCE